MNVANNATYKATPGTLGDIMIVPDNYKVRAKVNYRFSFFTSNPLFKNGQLGITLPAEILIDVNALQMTNVQGMNPYGDATFVYNATSRNLKIINAFDKAQPAQTFISFDLFGLQNGISTKPTAPIAIQTLDSAGKIIDQDVSQPLIFAANEINKIETQACADL